MAFKPNYRQQCAERDRKARAKQAEKLEKLHEKSEQRKAERDRPEGDHEENCLNAQGRQAAQPDRSTEQAGSAATDFDYAAAAELFLTKRSGGPRGRLGYRRFASAAEAIRFAIEELPAARILGVFMQVGDLRYDADGIRLLYQRHDYPLERSRADRGA